MSSKSNSLVRRRISRKSPRVKRCRISETALASLPADVLKRCFADGSFEEVLRVRACSRPLRLATLSALEGTAVEAEVVITDSSEDLSDVEWDNVLAFSKQRPCTPNALLATFQIPSVETASDLMELPQTLLEGLPCNEAFSLSVTSVVGMTSVLPILAVLGWPLRRLGFSKLEEEDMDAFCSLLLCLGGTLQSLHLQGFCCDNPVYPLFVRVVSVLPPTCTDLDVQHVLPLTRAFAAVPDTVLSLGTVVLMAEVWNNSRIVGMSLRHFLESFPRLPHLQELRLVIGPGHYEEPVWPQAETLQSTLGSRLPALLPSLRSLTVDVKVESVGSPPMACIVQIIRSLGVSLVIRSIGPASRQVNLETVQMISGKLRAAGVIFSCPD